MKGAILMKKRIKVILAVVLAVVLLGVGAFGVLYAGRIKTMSSIQKITDYSDGYNLYRMNVDYDYQLDDIIKRGITDDQSMIDAILAEALPLLPVKIKAPKFGCTAFTLTVRPRRCNTLEIELRGVGDMRLYGLTRVWQKGGSQ